MSFRTCGRSAGSRTMADAFAEETMSSHGSRAIARAASSVRGNPNDSSDGDACRSPAQDADMDNVFRAVTRAASTVTGGLYDSSHVDASRSPTQDAEMNDVFRAVTRSASTVGSSLYDSSSHACRPPTQDEMNVVFHMCRKNQWTSVLNSVKSNPLIPVTQMTMNNHIATTIIHQAITSKGETKARARVIEDILKVSPQAASIKNGYGSLPLHVIAQRNTKMDAGTKERLIKKLVSAFPGALVQQGGVGMRTPLHIIFTDYISPRLTEAMIQEGLRACFMKDRKGYLPVHVACSRHCSPEKLQMLLDVNPSSLVAKTNDGDTLLSLAIKTATKSHPNYALIDDLRRRLDLNGVLHHYIPHRVSSNDTTEGTSSISDGSPDRVKSGALPSSTRSNPRTRSQIRKRKRKVTADADDVKVVMEDDNEQANLLLHFSRHHVESPITNFASV
mmetsp:Transcript_11448/g.21163  ORF Transcript_11448/g.21163 Transcript_11448/m.21163 type:complete len:447 (+) Transcript_11448:521-1861(+)